MKMFPLTLSYTGAVSFAPLSTVTLQAFDRRSPLKHAVVFVERSVVVAHVDRVIA